MMKMCRYALITALAIFLAGCAGLREQPAPVEEAKPQPQQPAQPQPTVPTVPAVPSVPAQPGPIEHQDQQSGQPAPRVRHYDWNGAVQPLVGQMLQASGVNAGSILLVDSVNNRTNGSLNAGEATTALRSALAGNGKFTLVSAQQLAVAKQQLGLSPQDSLGSRSKAMGIARNVGAQYVLYSNATGNVNAPELKMQLMLVQTGEIILAEPEWPQRRQCDYQRRRPAARAASAARSVCRHLLFSPSVSRTPPTACQAGANPAVLLTLLDGGGVLRRGGEKRVTGLPAAVRLIV